MARLDVRTALRGAFVLLLMGSVMSGFSEPDYLTPGTDVAGTPTVGITGLAPADGSQISGEVIGLYPLLTPPLALLSTTAGDVFIQLLDPSMLANLTPGRTVIFSGQFLAADIFSASLLLDTIDQLSLGLPLGGSSSALILGAPLGNSTQSRSSSSSSGSSTSSSDNSNENSNKNSNDNSDSGATSTPTATATPTPTACSSAQTIALNPINGSAVKG